jgi:hypothetical protein
VSDELLLILAGFVCVAAHLVLIWLFSRLASSHRSR